MRKKICIFKLAKWEPFFKRKNVSLPLEGVSVFFLFQKYSRGNFLNGQMRSKDGGGTEFQKKNE